MAKWKVIPVMSFFKPNNTKTFTIDLASPLLDNNIVGTFLQIHSPIIAPHLVEVVSYNMDKSPKKCYLIDEVGRDYIKTKEIIPENEEISVKYYTVVKIK